MKQLQNSPNVFAKAVALFIFSFLTTIAWAQDKGIDINVDIGKPHHEWYENRVLWIIGGAVFVLLLVALVRGGGKSSG
jgi:hypothetical protein